jgi:Fe2+ or Zn2+ uptake regulation protein
VSAKASATGEKRPKGRPKAEGTLTSKIQDTIQKFVNAKKEFTANDIYDDLSKREKDVNKQSVITSVLKQMNSQFANISVSERPGAGPRPVKVYRP